MKLGFVALSGVRAHNPRLTELGLTLPGFVERNKVIASLPSLGLLTLAGMTPAAFEVGYYELPGDVDANPPDDFDVALISSFSARIKDAYRLADRYRAQGKTVILGGLHVTALPQEAAAHADTLVLGEGENVWAALLADLGKSRLRPIYDGRGRGFDLAQAPLPRFDLLDLERYNRLTVQTQRGCPFSCEFCASSIRLHPSFRTKPVGKVVREIQRIKELWREPFIEFADDNTFASKAHGRRLIEAIEPLGVRWFTETDVSVANDPELLGRMRDAGCAQILIGLESPRRESLTGVEQNGDWKAKQVDAYLEAIQRIQSYGISVNGCFVLGLDGDGPDCFEQVLGFVRDSGLHEVQVTVQTAFPGTPLYARLEHEGRLLRPRAWEMCTLFDVAFQPRGMSVRELETGLERLVLELYSEEERQRRRGAFRRASRGEAVTSRGIGVRSCNSAG